MSVSRKGWYCLPNEALHNIKGELEGACTDEQQQQAK